MNSELVCKCLDLRELLKETPEYKALIEAEKLMEENEEVSLLAYKKDMIICDYEDALNHYGRNAVETLQIQKKLAEVTSFLNNLPLVKDYRNKLDALNKLYSEVENELFKGIKDEVC